MAPKLSKKLNEKLNEWIPFWLRRRASEEPVREVRQELPESVKLVERAKPARRQPARWRPKEPPMRASNM